MTRPLPGSQARGGVGAQQLPLAQLLLPFVPYIAISVVHVSFRFADHPLEAPTKLLLMPLLAVAVLWASAGIRAWPARAVLMLVLGILFSWLGDGSATFFPMFADELPMMLLNFGLAHLMYVLLMWRGRGIAQRSFPRVSLLYVLAYVVLMAVLVQYTGPLTVPVLCYGVLLVATAAFASRCGAIVTLGGLSFLVSDAVLSFRIFAPEMMPDWTSGVVMLTYTLGQGLIAFGIVRALGQRAPAV